MGLHKIAQHNFKYWDSCTLPQRFQIFNPVPPRAGIALYALHTRTMIPTPVTDYLAVMAFLTALTLAGVGLIGWGVWCMIRDSRKY